MNETKRIAKINGKLNKRETIRRMYERAMNGESSTRMSFSYVARRLGFDVITMKRFVIWMKYHSNVNLHFEGRMIVFTETLSLN